MRPPPNVEITMSTETENTSETGTGQEDLSASLAANGEVEFVGTGEEKKPMSTQYAVLIGIVLLAPMAIWYMYKGKGDPNATAANAPPPAVQTANEFLNSGQDGVAAMRTMLRSTEKVVKDFLAYPSMAQIPLAELKTNPFRAQGAKVDDTEANSKRRKEEERQEIVKAVQSLQLQSIMSGKKGACMINNAMYMEGQQVGKFIVEKIAQASVIVKSGTYRFELKMQK
jgi:hypothetical protein